MTIVYPLKLKEEIMPIVELKSMEERTNKSIVLKQLIYTGLEDYMIRLCSKGRLSVGKVAEILDISIHEVYRKAKEKRIKLTATEDQLLKSKKVLEKLSKKAG